MTILNSIWNWILNIGAFLIVAPQILLVLALVVIGVVTIIGVIWKITLHVSDKLRGTDTTQKDKESSIRECKEYWDNFYKTKPKSKWNRMVAWVKDLFYSPDISNYQ